MYCARQRLDKRGCFDWSLHAVAEDRGRHRRLVRRCLLTRNNFSFAEKEKSRETAVRRVPSREDYSDRRRMNTSSERRR